MAHVGHLTNKRTDRRRVHETQVEASPPSRRPISIPISNHPNPSHIVIPILTTLSPPTKSCRMTQCTIGNSTLRIWLSNHDLSVRSWQVQPSPTASLSSFKFCLSPYPSHRSISLSCPTPTSTQPVISKLRHHNTHTTILSSSTTESSRPSTQQEHHFIHFPLMYKN